MKPRWLLDHNIPVQLVDWLAARGIQAETAFAKNWHGLSDPDLLKHAVREFEVLLTRDQGFSDSSGSRQSETQIALPILNLPQAPATAFVAAFAEAWARGAVQPEAGALVRWPI